MGRHIRHGTAIKINFDASNFGRMQQAFVESNPTARQRIWRCLVAPTND
jgi:hypothetical protein